MPYNPFFFPNLGTMVSSMHKKTGCVSKDYGISFNAIDAVAFVNLESADSSVSMGSRSRTNVSAVGIEQVSK